MKTRGHKYKIHIILAGFLLKYAKSGELAGELASKLDSFLLKFQVSSEQTVDFEASSTQQIQPRL